MTNDERAKNPRLDALGITPLENIIYAQKPTQNKPQLSLQFKGGVARLVLASDKSISCQYPR